MNAERFVSPGQPAGLPIYPVRELQLTKQVYDTAEQAQAAGFMVPPFNPLRPQKGWIDPDAKAGDRSHFRHYMIAGDPFPSDLYILEDEAASFNLLPGASFADNTFRQSNPVLALAADANAVVPVPIRAPLANEKLHSTMFPGGGPMIENIDLMAATPAGSGTDSAKIEELLRAVKAIAARLQIAY